MREDIINMQITYTRLGIDDHGCFTFTLTLTNGTGMVCGFGGWRLGRAGSDLLRAVIETVGVKSWEDVKDKYVRVKFDEHHAIAIGHILKDNWLNIREWLEKWKAENGPEVKQEEKNG